MELGAITYLVKDYDEAIKYFTGKLNFVLVEDTRLNETKRWVLVSPGKSSCRILLAKASDPEQEKYVGNQTGGRVFLFLSVEDFDKTYNEFFENGVEFIEQPRNEAYGKVAVFKDLYGNKWDLIEKRK